MLNSTMDDIVVSKNRRGRLCCCDKENFVHKFTITALIIDVLLFVASTVLYTNLLFSGSF